MSGKGLQGVRFRSTEVLDVVSAYAYPAFVESPSPCLGSQSLFGLVNVVYSSVHTLLTTYYALGRSIAYSALGFIPLEYYSLGIRHLPNVCDYGQSMR